MAMLIVDGVALTRDPSSLKVYRNQVNASDAGRDQAGNMHVNRVATKRKLECQWGIVHHDDFVQIFSALAPEYISVRYYDPFDDAMETRTFYTGDHGADYYAYEVPCVGGTTFKTIDIDLIEV